MGRGVRLQNHQICEVNSVLVVCYIFCFVGIYQGWEPFSSVIVNGNLVDLFVDCLLNLVNESVDGLYKCMLTNVDRGVCFITEYGCNCVVRHFNRKSDSVVEREG